MEPCSLCSGTGKLDMDRPRVCGLKKAASGGWEFSVIEMLPHLYINCACIKQKILKTLMLR